MRACAVTGSRRAAGSTSASLTIAVSSEALSNTAQIGLGGPAQQAAAIFPGNNPVGGSVDVQASLTNSLGRAPDLRGLGLNRSLVLVDGRRAQPST